MRGGTVPLVAVPLIGRVPRIAAGDVHHQPVPSHLGDDGRRGHRGAVAVALDLGDDMRGNRHVRRVEGVERFGDVIVGPVENRPDPHRRRVPSRRHGPAITGRRHRRHKPQLPFHGVERAQGRDAECMTDAPLVDLTVAGLSDRARRTPCLQRFEQRLAASFRQHLGIGDTVRNRQLRQVAGAYRRGADHHRTGQRTASDLVESHNQAIPLCGQFPFQLQRRTLMHHISLPPR